jgi:Cu(I)/Ag(I) efflux system membrane protein CusA/SilA
MVENTTHYLTRKYGSNRITGNITEDVIAPCREVGRPIFFSVLIMVITFLPVFALSGIEGKMFHPLAFTKTFALIGVSILSITFVPALIPIFIRGRLSREEDNFIVRSFIEVYRPVLSFLLNKPKLVMWLFVVLVSIGLLFWRSMGREFMPSLDEGSILDMPISIPRMSVTEAADDIKQRDAVIREFPEVASIVGKAGRAETPTDPAPLSMIESVVNLRPKELWAKRHLKYDDAVQENMRILNRFSEKGWLATTATIAQKQSAAKNVMNAYNNFDATMRAENLRRQVAFEDSLGQFTIKELVDYIFDNIERNKAWKRTTPAAEKEHVAGELNSRYAKLFRSAPLLFDVESAAREVLLHLKDKGYIESPAAALQEKHSTFISWIRDVKALFTGPRPDFYERAHDHLVAFQEAQWKRRLRTLNWELFDVGVPQYVRDAADEIRSHAKSEQMWTSAKIDPAEFERTVKQLSEEFHKNAYLWPLTKDELIKEMDSRVRTLGWANIWTQPIINRIDMLATGIRTMVGIKVYGPDEETIQTVSNQLTSVLRNVRGAVDVTPDQAVGKGYIEIQINRKKASRYGINVGDIQDVIEVALGGKPITTTVEGRERYPVRVRYGRDFRADEDSVKRILVSSNSSAMGGEMPVTKASPGGADTTGEAKPTQVMLSDVADVKVVEGPVVIKSENGLLRNYVQLNVRDRDVVGFVENAKRVVAHQLQLPKGVYLEWTGQYEYQVRARKTLRVVFPAVILLIFLILYITYNDLADATLMMLAVPGALAGGVIFQRIFGYNFSVAVWVGYIACFGMATETGIIMLVYLRNAIAERGGLQAIGSLKELSAAVVSGAVHRLRPKLLTEGTAIIGLAPMLWAHGVGAEIIKPMAAPVLGGLLIADEVIDIFIPVLFYHLRARRWRKLHESDSQISVSAEVLQ